MRFGPFLCILPSSAQAKLDCLRKYSHSGIVDHPPCVTPTKSTHWKTLGRLRVGITEEEKTQKKLEKIPYSIRLDTTPPLE